MNVCVVLSFFEMPWEETSSSTTALAQVLLILMYRFMLCLCVCVQVLSRYGMAISLAVMTG